VVSDLVRTCVWCPPGAARRATDACPRCGRPTCDQHSIRQSTPPSRCDWCEAEFRDRVNGGREIGVTVAFVGSPIVAGTALVVMGHVLAGGAAFMLGPLVGVAIRVYQRRRGAMRRRFLAERAEPLPPARLIDRRPDH